MCSPMAERASLSPGLCKAPRLASPPPRPREGGERAGEIFLDPPMIPQRWGGGGFSSLNKQIAGQGGRARLGPASAEAKTAPSPCTKTKTAFDPESFATFPALFPSPPVSPTPQSTDCSEPLSYAALQAPKETLFKGDRVGRLAGNLLLLYNTAKKRRNSRELAVAP